MISLLTSLNRLVIIFTVSIIISITACTHDADISGIPEVCFTGEVLPVFQNNCTMSGCHSGGGDEEMPLRTYSEIMNGITPGKPDASEIYRSITSKWGQMMPPDQPLSIGNRTLIRLWIEQGAGETSCPTSVDGGKSDTYVSRACFSRDILPVIVSHCAGPGCHDAVTHREGYNLTGYNSIRGMVSPGNPPNSRLYRVIIVSGEDMMPPAGSPRLTTAQVDSIRKWITYGALDESCGEICDTINPVSFSGTLWPLVQQVCTGCHSGAAPAGNVLLNSYQNVASVASSGLLLKSLNGTGVTRMPPSGQLSSCRIAQFRKWITGGYPNN